MDASRTYASRRLICKTAVFRSPSRRFSLSHVCSTCARIAGAPKRRENVRGEIEERGEEERREKEGKNKGIGCTNES